MTAPLRVAVAGAGVGVRYARSFGALDGVDVVALCARTSERAAPAAELGIAATYTELDALLAAERPDVLVVATPNDLHHAHTLAGLAAGAHVVCDKPLALDAPTALELWQAAERGGRRHLVPFWLRHVPAFAGARALLARGELGPPTFVTLQYLNCGWGDPHGPMRWQFELARAGAGALANIGSHAIDLVQWLAGDLARVAAGTRVDVPERRWPDGTPARPDAEDTAAFVAELSGGGLVSFLASSVAYAARTQLRVAVHCQGGSVTAALELAADGVPTVQTLERMRAGDAAPQPVPLPAGQGGPLHAAAYDALAAELVAAIREDRPAEPGFEAGVRVQEVIDAALAAGRGRRWVDVARQPSPPVARSSLS